MNIIDDLNEQLCRLSKIRHQKMGDMDSGMYNYYVGRLKNKAMIDGYDRYLIEYVAKNIPIDKSICELGAGLAQVSMALSKIGYTNITAYECDTGRARYAADLNRKLGLNVKIAYESFQKLDPNKFNVIIANNLVNTSNNFKDEIEIIKKWLKHNVTFIFRRDAYDHNNDSGTILEDHGIKYTELERGFIRI